ncbi:hypothetical protein GCM10011581_31820 [Saccharopolyspora subtropica]|uniref:Lipoprotein n=2 Tax=Saccharopolyspora thermophila TaxID=89367 RepID=A0A917NDR0_9PSEU|nr:hypothetical protein GCM10011581_31820 [Saccharopolyspora subtropica]
MRTARAAACALVTAMAVASCSNSGSTGAGLGNPQGTGEAPASATDAAPIAADGTNFDACADGNCEVVVSGPVDIRLTGQGGGITLLSVTEVDSTGLRFTTASAEGDSGSGKLTDGCTLRFYSGGGGSSCGGEQAPPERETGVLAMQLASVQEGAVVLRLVAGEPGPPPTRYVPPMPHIPQIPW